MRNMCFLIEEVQEEELSLDQKEVFFGKQTILLVQEAMLRQLNSDTMEIVNTTRLWENDHSYFFNLTENHLVIINPQRPTSSDQAFESLRP